MNEDEWMNDFNLGLIEFFYLSFNYATIQSFISNYFGTRYNFSKIIIRFLRVRVHLTDQIVSECNLIRLRWRC